MKNLRSLSLITSCQLFQVRKSFFAELGIYNNESFIRQVYTDFILGKANHTNENFEVEMRLYDVVSGDEVPGCFRTLRGREPSMSK